MNWQQLGACRDEEPDLFFPDGDRGPVAQLQIAEAKAVCRRCLVLSTCRDWALATKQSFGVWGALSETERQGLLLREGRRPRQEVPA
jgi:WhiB family redox-sensing transcriptional regulator